MVSNKELRFLLTNNCNYNCIYCNREDFHETAPNHLSPDDITYLFTVCQKNFDWQNTTLTGGEPLSAPAFDQIVEGLAKHHAQITVVSNGYQLDQHLDAVGLLHKINLSLPTLDENKYNFLVNRKGKLSQVMHNLQLVKKHAPKVAMQLNVVLYKGFNDNLADVQNLLDFAAANGCNIKFIELNNNKYNMVSLSTISDLLAKADTECLSPTDKEPQQFRYRQVAISLTRSPCAAARLQADPTATCAEKLDINITPNGCVNRCLQTNDQISLMPEIMCRDEQGLITKLNNLNLGQDCPLAKTAPTALSCEHERI